MSVQNLTCIVCPFGCSMQVVMDDAGAVVHVQGNTCPRGDAYARKEVTNPTRVVTSTVCVTGSKDCTVTVPVKTVSDIPKSKIFDCMKAIKNITVSAPVQIGDVIKANVAGTGVNIVATKNVL